MEEMNEAYKDRQELVNIVAVFLSKQGLKLYEAKPKNDEVVYLPDLLGIYRKKVEIDVEHRIDVIVETCESVNEEETKSKIEAIANNAKKSEEGVMLFVPAICYDKAKEKLEEWNVADIVKIVPISFKIKSEGKED